MLNYIKNILCIQYLLGKFFNNGYCTKGFIHINIDDLSNYNKLKEIKFISTTGDIYYYSDCTIRNVVLEYKKYVDYPYEVDGYDMINHKRGLESIKFDDLVFIKI